MKPLKISIVVYQERMSHQGMTKLSANLSPHDRVTTFINRRSVEAPSKALHSHSYCSAQPTTPVCLEMTWANLIKPFYPCQSLQEVHISCNIPWLPNPKSFCALPVLTQSPTPPHILRPVVLLVCHQQNPCIFNLYSEWSLHLIPTTSTSS